MYIVVISHVAVVISHVTVVISHTTVIILLKNIYNQPINEKGK